MTVIGDMITMTSVKISSKIPETRAWVKVQTLRHNCRTNQKVRKINF